MKLIRCKPGDLALVIYDIPGCIKNVGRLVRVRGPLALNRMYQLQCWLIQPASLDPWYVDYYSEVRRSKSFANRNLEHPDEWLLPVRPHRNPLRAGWVVGLAPSRHPISEVTRLRAIGITPPTLEDQATARACPGSH